MFLSGFYRKSKVLAQQNSSKIVEIGYIYHLERENRIQKDGFNCPACEIGLKNLDCLLFSAISFHQWQEKILLEERNSFHLLFVRAFVLFLGVDFCVLELVRASLIFFCEIIFMFLRFAQLLPQWSSLFFFLMLILIHIFVGAPGSLGPEGAYREPVPVYVITFLKRKVNKRTIVLGFRPKTIGLLTIIM